MRYILDFYEGKVAQGKAASFYVDVRPAAFDSVESAMVVAKNFVGWGGSSNSTAEPQSTNKS